MAKKSLGRVCLRYVAIVALIGLGVAGHHTASAWAKPPSKAAESKKSTKSKQRSAPTGSTAARNPLETALLDVLNDRALRRANLGLYVVRVSDGAELFAHQPEKLLVPASTVKIVTTAAALHALRPDYQFPTEVYGAVDTDGAVDGDLVLKGYGDPYLVPERVWYLANQVYLRGVKDVSGDLLVDDSYFAGSLMAKGMEQDASSASYMAPAGATSASFNTIRVHVLPGARPGSDARIRIEPASDYTVIDADVQTVRDQRTHITITSHDDGNNHLRLRIRGRIGVGDEPYREWRRIEHPAIFAGELLKHQLMQVGIRVKGKVRVGAVAEGMPKLVTIYAPNLWELITHLNKNSNNFMAAQVAYALGAQMYGAPGSWEKAQHAMQAFLEEEIGIVPGSYRLDNASGLHDVNRMSAKQIVRVLQYMYHHNAAGPEFVTSLAVAGSSGTLQDRMTDSEAMFRLRGKTGTLAIASALSGYVTTMAGDVLAFSMLTNNYKTGITDVWRAQDRIGAILVNLGSATPGGRLPSKRNHLMQRNQSTIATQDLLHSD